MPDVTIEIGGRPFTVACQPGEEAFLQAAAAMLDREAQVLVQSGARLTESRLLLMAGLMLADKAISAEDELKALDARVAEQDAALAEARDRPAPEPVEVVREIEVPVERVVEKEVVREVVPSAALDRLAQLATRAEALAAEAADKVGPAD